MSLESLRIALAALRANKLRSALTMLGIVIGVAAVIAVVAPLAGSLSCSPFANAFIPSGTAVIYAAVYFVAVIAVAGYRFERRDL